MAPFHASVRAEMDDPSLSFPFIYEESGTEVYS